MSVTLGTDIHTGKTITLGDPQRRSGLYVLGKAGMGKSTLLTNLIDYDMIHGTSVFFIDPHGEAISDLIHGCKAMPVADEQEKILILDPTDEDYSFGINLLSCPNVASLNARSTTYTRAHNVFQKLFENEKGDLGIWLELIIQNTLPVFIENQGYTLAEIPMFLTDEDFRKHLLQNVQYETHVLDFWKREFQPKQAESAITRMRRFLGNAYIRHIVGQKDTTVDFTKQVIHPPQFVFVRLPAELSADIKKFIGTILLSELLHAIRTRPVPARERLYGVYVDEFQHFAAYEDMATLITEGRKFGCAFCGSHQERYGQFGENQKILGATQACANKVLFQVTPKDAQELAPEFAHAADTEMQAQRGGELIISPTPVEDVWFKGHPNKDIMEIRKRYFWLGDLWQKFNPSFQKYFVFDPATNLHINAKNPGQLNFDAFTDWGMYRSSWDMAKQGSELLNKYYYDWMNHTYTANTPVTDAQLTQILQIIECFSGVMGIRPVMQPYIPDDKRAVFAQRIADQEIAELHELLLAYRPGKHEDYESRQEREDKVLEIKGKIANIRRRGTDVYIPRLVPPWDVNKVQSLALQSGMSARDVENLIEWEVRPVDSVEAALLKAFVRGEYDKNKDKRYLDQYHKKMIDLNMRYKFGEYYDQIPSGREEEYALFYQKTVNRVVWQMGELIIFIGACFELGGELLENDPVKIPSSKYEEHPKRDRTQRELIDEMTQELLNLPRFTAYTKIITEENGEQVTLKAKIQTPPRLEDQSRVYVKNASGKFFNPFYNIEAEITALTRRLCCRPRTAIEAELKNRREGWQKPPGMKRAKIKIPPPKKDEPPPRGY